MSRPADDSVTDREPTAPVGLVIALESEASAVLGRGRFGDSSGRPFRRGETGGVPWICVLSGVGPGRAYKATQDLIAEGVSPVVSLGVSGGLEPELRPGTVVVGTKCREHIPGEVPTTVWTAGENAESGLMEILDKARVPAIPGTLVTVPAPALTSDAKKFLRTEHDALAVDMESSAVARAAVEGGVPFIALRAICDDAGREVPPEVVNAVSDAGSANIGSIISMILRKPSLLPKLMGMGRDYNKALKALAKSFKAAAASGFASLS